MRNIICFGDRTRIGTYFLYQQQSNNLLFVYREVIVNPLAPQVAVLIEAGQKVHTLNYI